MTTRILVFAGVTLLWGWLGVAPGGGGEFGTAGHFAAAKVHFEQNATDGDVEVVFEVQGGDKGLTGLHVVSPDGRLVIDFRAPDVSTLGIRQFHFESPEPADVESLKSAYPEGVYTFTGATAAGEEFHGEWTLSHRLPPTTSFLRPKPDARGVSINSAEITWTPVAGIAAYLIEIEQVDRDTNITAKLPGSTATFAVPAGFLRPGTEYQMGIGTVTDEGNISFVETTFTTAGNQ